MSRTRVPCFLASTALAAAAGAAPQSSVVTRVEPWIDPTPQPRGEAVLRRTMLVTHATARALVGVPPLLWSEELAASAREHAEALAQSGRFDHLGRTAARTGVGENLWAGSHDAYTYTEMVDAWLSEARDYINAPTPRFSRTGAWKDVGHYSQMIWRHTTHVGCAMVAGSRDDVLVCRYAPAGNVMGQAAF
ncbi:CAP domain-containing protein [Sphingomonas sp. KR1UV-12]|uniref:CAP domain-containing protein n=1 Tax=Sphingomonas aurea TaxID=3063994 RepID=A0ABT9EFK3_9SPHN|nr:CAP domain-containing protein [Sphingomonas sp. KR1UV-12]MDP1025746.1 CAP domain-containing protein [Sphingomonas sp. KR1UV-12]